VHRPLQGPKAHIQHQPITAIRHLAFLKWSRVSASSLSLYYPPSPPQKSTMLAAHPVIQPCELKTHHLQHEEPEEHSMARQVRTHYLHTLINSETERGHTPLQLIHLASQFQTSEYCRAKFGDRGLFIKKNKDTLN
jgi:hypothetical protein